MSDELSRENLIDGLMRASKAYGELLLKAAAHQPWNDDDRMALCAHAGWMASALAGLVQRMTPGADPDSPENAETSGPPGHDNPRRF